MSQPPDEEEQEELPNSRDLADAAHEQQLLGGKLIQLTAEQIGRLSISESLADALLEAKRLPPRTKAMQRQLQLIGRLMRSVDAEVVARELAEITSGRQAAGLQRAAKAWCARLLSEGDAVLQELAAERPGLDRQRLRQIIRRVAKLAPDSAARARGERELTAELRQLLG